VKEKFIFQFQKNEDNMRTSLNKMEFHSVFKEAIWNLGRIIYTSVTIQNINAIIITQ
jgi:hypothetical protein